MLVQSTVERSNAQSRNKKEEEEIGSVALLVALDPSDLTELGFKMGHRAAIKQLKEKLDGGGPPGSVPPATAHSNGNARVLECFVGSILMRHVFRSNASCTPFECFVYSISLIRYSLLEWCVCSIRRATKRAG